MIILLNSEGIMTLINQADASQALGFLEFFIIENTHLIIKIYHLDSMFSFFVAHSP